MTTRPLASLVEQLASVPENGKAEIINGEVVRISPTGGRPARASGRVYASLLQHEESQGGGYAVPHNAGFIGIFRRGDTSDAEPAVPGWRFAVDLLLR